MFFLTASGAPVIVLLFNAGPLDVTWAKLNPAVDVIMACFYPAQSTGEALYRVFTNQGSNSVPAARLTATWPAFLEQVIHVLQHCLIIKLLLKYSGSMIMEFCVTNFLLQNWQSGFV